MKEKVICVFGASTTWGAWDLDKGGWVNRLRLYLDKESLEGKHYFNVYNLGIDGNTSGDLLKRIESECKSRDPDTIIFSIGTNDSFSDSHRNPKVPIKKFEEHLIQLISIARKFTKDIVFLSLYDLDESKTTPVAWNKNGYYFNSTMRNYNDILKKIVNQEKIFYVDLSNLFNKKDFEDGVHLTSQGHEKLLHKVKDFLERNELI